MNVLDRRSKEVRVRGIVVGFTALVLLCAFFTSPLLAFESGRLGLIIGGGINFPVLDFADQSALGATLGFGFKAGLKYQLGEKFGLVGYYNFRSFDTHFIEPPTGHEGGYGKYRLHTFSFCPRIYIRDEAPSTFIECGVGGYIPYFYIRGDASDDGIIPDDLALGLNYAFGWHTDNVDLIFKYHIFKTDKTTAEISGTTIPGYFIHYVTFDALLNLIPEE